MTYDAATGSACDLNRIVELSKNSSGLFEKARSSSCRPHASEGSLKKRYSQHVFERPHAATNRGWLVAKHPGCTRKTQTISSNQSLGKRDDIDYLKQSLIFERRL